MKSTTLYKIRITRESKGYSQEYVAKKLKVTQQAYSSMEKNPEMMTLKRLKDLCVILDVNLATLLGEDNIYVQQNYNQHRIKEKGKQIFISSTSEIEVYNSHISSLKDEITQYRKVIDSIIK
jgi:transcriptional regulator with XRE-family HTH domain